MDIVPSFIQLANTSRASVHERGKGISDSSGEEGKGSKFGSLQGDVEGEMGITNAHHIARISHNMSLLEATIKEIPVVGGDDREEVRPKDHVHSIKGLPRESEVEAPHAKRGGILFLGCAEGVSVQ